jgi:GT2 family glycosyltransferase
MRPRILLAITVYNGWAFVPRCIDSARRIDASVADVDILVLDDASPAPGFSADLMAFCAERGVGYYRTPRNLGIVRNVNLGLLRAVSDGYSHVIISNSDVIYPANAVTGMLAVLNSDSSIGSVTAWSNNVSVFSLPNADPDRFLGDQDVVDWVSASLNGLYGASALDVPAGISFCILIPTDVVRRVGLMDTIYGRGYCEETDWTLRSLAAGYRIALSPGVFVYHSGRGSTVDAGLVTGGHTTVPENEAIIDLRYPLFRSQVSGFLASDLLSNAHADATERIVRDATRQFGWHLALTWLGAARPIPEVVTCVADVDGRDSQITFRFRGFEHPLDISEGDDPMEAILTFAGGPPSQVLHTGAGRAGRALASRFGINDVDAWPAYPVTV